MKLLRILILPIILFSQANNEWFKDFNGSGEKSMGHYILFCEDYSFLQAGKTYDYPN